MATLFIGSKFSATDTAGAPLSGGKVYTYAAGTLTPLATYTDQSGASENTNPVILDSQGRANIWIGDDSYKFVVADANGVTAPDGTVDNISAPLSSGDLSDTTSAAKGLGKIGGFNYALNYAVGTLGAWLKNETNVFWFIPPAEHAAILAGTSTYDASTDIVSAITWAAAITPCRLVFPTGKYKCDAVLGSFTASDLIVDLNGSTLDFSAIATSSTDTLLIFEGAYSTGVALTGNASANQKAVAAVSTGFAAGDFVRVYSEKVWDSTRTSTRYGELNFIESAPDSASVTLTMELQSAYATSDTAKIEKLTPVRNVTVKNGKVVGPSGNDEIRGLRFRLGVNCRFENISSFDVDYLHMQLTDCIACKVTGCYFEEANSSTTGYGLSFADASCDCIAYGNFFVNVRHSLSTNTNVTTSYGITRRIRFEANDIRDSAKATGGTGGDAIDTHAGAADIDIINNTVHSSSGAGINVEAKSARIHGNRVKHTTGPGIYFHPYSDEVPNCSIEGNRCEQIGDADGVNIDAGILVAVGAIAPSSVIVSGNHSESSTSEAIRVTGSADSTLRYLTVSGNVCKTTYTGAAMYLRNVDTAVVVGNTLVNTVGNVGLLVEDSSYVSVGVNRFRFTGTGTDLYACRFIGTGTRNEVIGLAAENGGTFSGSKYGVHLASTITNTKAEACNFSGMTLDVNLGSGSGNSGLVVIASAAYNPGSLADAAGVTTTVAATGAALGDYVRATFSLDLQGITMTAWVSAADTVSVRFQNESGGVLDLASGTIKVRVERIG